MRQQATTNRFRSILAAASIVAVAAGLASVAFAGEPGEEGAVLAPTSRPSSAPVVDAATQALIDRLADADPAQRDAAQKELVESPIDGPTLIAALQAAKTSEPGRADLDFAMRIDALLVQAQERAEIGPSYVTYAATDKPLNEVLSDLSALTGAPFADPAPYFGGAENLPKVTLNLEKATFWSAMRELQKAGKIAIQPQGGNEGWRVFRSGMGFVPMGSGIESGAFLVQPTNASYNRNVSYQNGNGDVNDSFSLSFQVMVEPKVRLDSTQGIITLERAVDNHGNDLNTAERAMPFSIGGGERNLFGVNVQLRYPKENPGDRIVEVRGNIRMSIARRTAKLETDDLLAADAQPLRLRTPEGLTVVVERERATAPVGVEGNEAEPDAQQQSPQRTITLKASVSGFGENTPADRMMQTLQQIKLVDDAGRRFNLTNFSQTRYDQNQIDVQISFTQQAGQPPQANRRADRDRRPDATGTDAVKLPKVKFSLEIPTSMRQIEIPFVMQDLRMP